MTEESKLLKSCLNPWLHGLDMYPAGATIQDVLAKSGLAADEIIQLNRNETTIGTSPKVIAAVEKAVSSANYYPEVNCQDLVDDLTDYYSGLGLDMGKLGIVIGNGMDSILDNIAHLFLSKDSSIIVSSPTFIYYELIANWSGAELIDVPRNIDKEKNIYTTDPDAILAAVKDNTKVVFLCSPNNPTGELTNIETIEYLAKNLDCMLYVDHAYIQFCEDKQDARHLIEKYPNLIVGYTFSKAYAMAGYRVGYAIMHQEIKNRFVFH